MEGIIGSIVLILDGNSKIDAHVRCNICYLICLWHFIRARDATNRIIFLRKRPIFFLLCATCSVLPSNISTISFQIKFYNEVHTLLPESGPLYLCPLETVDGPAEYHVSQASVHQPENRVLARRDIQY